MDSTKAIPILSSFALTSDLITTFDKRNFKEKYHFCEAGLELNLIQANLM